MTAPLEWELSDTSEPVDAAPSRALTPEEEAITEWLARREDEPVEVWDTAPEDERY